MTIPFRTIMNKTFLGSIQKMKRWPIQHCLTRFPLAGKHLMVEIISQTSHIGRRKMVCRLHKSATQVKELPRLVEDISHLKCNGRRRMRLPVEKDYVKIYKSKSQRKRRGQEPPP